MAWRSRGQVPRTIARWDACQAGVFDAHLLAELCELAAQPLVYRPKDNPGDWTAGEASADLSDCDASQGHGVDERIGCVPGPLPRQGEGRGTSDHRASVA